MTTTQSSSKKVISYVNLDILQILILQIQVVQLIF